MTSDLENKMLDMLNQRRVIRGTEAIALETTTLNGKYWVIRRLRALAAAGKIIIIPSRGGRGNKTIYKRNPNQPGTPRKRRGGMP